MKKNEFISILLLITFWIVSIQYTNYTIADRVADKMLEIEYDKVWWKENYVKINEIQKQQIIEWLKQYKWKSWSDSVNNNWWSDSWLSSISIEVAKKVTSDWTYKLWNQDAELTWVEYSDLECPFCKKLHKSWTIEEILEAYDWKVNFVFKQFPLDFHPQANMEAQALLCAWDLNWADKYYEFLDKIFTWSKTNWRSYTKESISKLWSTIWISESKLLLCIESWKFKQKAENEMKEWGSLFGISGTPWNVLINNKTGKWDKLPWAYPTASFKEKIDILLK